MLSDVVCNCIQFVLSTETFNRGVLLMLTSLPMCYESDSLKEELVVVVRVQCRSPRAEKDRRVNH